jgi:hypothetical protein
MYEEVRFALDYRWREMDSNHLSLSEKAQYLLAIERGFWARFGS